MKKRELTLALIGQIEKKNRTATGRANVECPTSLRQMITTISLVNQNFFFRNQMDYVMFIIR